MQPIKKEKRSRNPEARNGSITVRFSPSEKVRVHELADKYADGSVSALIRHFVFKGKSPRVQILEELEKAAREKASVET